jgi:formylglycine-generating enzyme required for sulfatase activity
MDVRSLVDALSVPQLIAVAPLLFGCASFGQVAVDESRTKSFTQEISGTTVSFQMNLVPGGTLKKPDAFDPSVTIEVPIAPLYMCEHETTWDMYDIFAFALDLPEPQRDGVDATTRPSRPYLPADRGFGHSNYPVISVAFNGAKEFCKWLSAKTGRTYRLATRDEWEWAARAGTTNEASDEITINAAAWHAGNSPEKTQEIKGKAPNAWGLFDMLGNAGEWTVNSDGKGRLCGGHYRTPAADVKFALSEKQTADWNKRDPQMPKSKWWLSDGPFASFRIVCEIQEPEHDSDSGVHP